MPLQHSGRSRSVVVFVALTLVVAAVVSGWRLTSTTDGTTPAIRIQPPLPGNVVFGDDFRQSGPDFRPITDLWGEPYSGTFVSGDVRAKAEPSNVIVHDGVMSIWARGIRPGGADMTVGGVCFCGPRVPDFKYGIIEFGVRIDKGNGVATATGIINRRGDGWDYNPWEVPDGSRDKSYVTSHWSPVGQTDFPSIPGDYSQWTDVRVVHKPDFLATYFRQRNGSWLQVAPAVTDPKQMPVTQADQVFFQVVPGVEGWGERADDTSPDALRLQVRNFSVQLLPGVSLVGLGEREGERTVMRTVSDDGLRAADFGA